MNGPKVLEFNARFGDPEAQAYLMSMSKDLLDLLEISIDGSLGNFTTDFVTTYFHGVAVCVVMASAGYPGAYAKGKIIHGLEEAGRLPQTKIFHAGTAPGRRPVRHQWRARPGRDRAGRHACRGAGAAPIWRWGKFNSTARSFGAILAPRL